MKILLVEYDPDLQHSIGQYLQKEGYAVTIAGTYEQAAQRAHDYDYDCLVIDLMLPDGNGLALINEQKSRHSEAGIIVVSAKNTLADKLTGLELGADDYLTKPFFMAELNARIHAILRRRHFDGHNQLTVGELTLWLEQQRVTVRQKVLQLTGKEFELLLFFVTNRGRILSKSALAEHVWGETLDRADSHEFMYTHIKNLRRKLIAAGSPDYIQTRYGAGYVFSTQLL